MNKLPVPAESSSGSGWLGIIFTHVKKGAGLPLALHLKVMLSVSFTNILSGSSMLQYGGSRGPI